MITTQLRRHKRIALDTSVLIYHLQGYPHYSEQTSAFLDAIQGGNCQGVSLFELLVMPLRKEQPGVADEYEILLTNFPSLTLAPLTRDVMLAAAALRAKYGLKTPDALIVATALEQQATLLVTNDRRWRRVPGIEIYCLSDAIACIDSDDFREE